MATSQANKNRAIIRLKTRVDDFQEDYKSNIMTCESLSDCSSDDVDALIKQLKTFKKLKLKQESLDVENRDFMPIKMAPRKKNQPAMSYMDLPDGKKMIIKSLSDMSIKPYDGPDLHLDSPIDSSDLYMSRMNGLLGL